MRGAQTTAFLTLVLLWGCRADQRPFLGTWRVTGKLAASVGRGPGARTFGGSTPKPFPGYAVTFTKGTHSDLASLDTRGCALAWRVSGKRAQLEPDQSCEVAGRMTSTAAMEAGEVTLEVVDPGHLEIRGHVAGTLSQGGAIVRNSQPATADLEGTLLRAEDGG